MSRWSNRVLTCMETVVWAVVRKMMEVVTVVVWAVVRKMMEVVTVRAWTPHLLPIQPGTGGGCEEVCCMKHSNQISIGLLSRWLPAAHVLKEES